ncbi:MAG: hypothetical protein ACREJ9_14665 [Candidatus Rokuibacteriota bacterium]
MKARPPSEPLRRRLVITVCPREAGSVALSVMAGGRAVRLDAEAILLQLAALVAERRLGHLVSVREGCAGACAGRGPNVSVAIYPAPRPGAASSQVAIGWKTYVYSLATLPCLARIIDDNLLPWASV